MSKDTKIIIHKREVTKLGKELESLENQYKQVILELRRQVKWLKSNAWKVAIVEFYYRLKSLFERR